MLIVRQCLLFLNVELFTVVLSLIIDLMLVRVVRFVVTRR